MDNLWFWVFGAFDALIVIVMVFLWAGLYDGHDKLKRRIQRLERLSDAKHGIDPNYRQELDENEVKDLDYQIDQQIQVKK